MKEELKTLKKKDECKDQQLAAVCHDIRAPLNSTKYTLKEAVTLIDKKNESLKYIDIAIVSLDYLNNLVNTILDYFQFKNKTIRLLVSTENIIDIISFVKNLFVYQIKYNENEIIISEIPNCLITTDCNKLKQVLINLISNAVKFTIKGKIMIKVKEKKNNLIKFTVKDTGIGIKPENLKKLCTMWNTFDDKGQNPNGIGLGLFVSRKIVSSLGPYQKMFIKSKIEEGSSFSFFVYKNIEDIEVNKDFDIILKKDNSENENDNNIGEKYNFKRNLNVLLVDDCAFSILGLKSIFKTLKNVSFNIFEAASGNKAIEIFKEKNKVSDSNNLDIIIIDCLMPIKNGFETTYEICKLQKNEFYKKCLIFGCSAHVSDKEILQGKKVGMENLFKKPLKKNDFEEIIKRVFVNT